MAGPVSNATGWRVRLTRRRFLAASALVAGGLGTYTWRIEPHWIEIVRRDLPIANLPAALDGRRLVQISDLHAGDAVDTDYLIDAVKRVSSLEPSLTVITGDFMTCRSPEHIDTVTSVLEHLRPGPLGCVAIFGNHDYTLGWSRKDVADALERRLSQLDIHVLRNECRVVEGLQIVGLDDFWSPCFKPDAIIPKVDWRRPALDPLPQPRRGRPSRPRGMSRLDPLRPHARRPMQTAVPAAAPLPVANRRYTAGEFTSPTTAACISIAAWGYLLRVRFNVRPEITVFHLHSAERCLILRVFP